MNIGRGMIHVGAMLFPSSWLGGPPDPPEHEWCRSCGVDLMDDPHEDGCPNDWAARLAEQEQHDALAAAGDSLWTVDDA